MASRGWPPMKLEDHIITKLNFELTCLIVIKNQPRYIMFTQIYINF